MEALLAYSVLFFRQETGFQDLRGHPMDFVLLSTSGVMRQLRLKSETRESRRQGS